MSAAEIAIAALAAAIGTAGAVTALGTANPGPTGPPPLGPTGPPPLGLRRIPPPPPRPLSPTGPTGPPLGPTGPPLGPTGPPLGPTGPPLGPTGPPLGPTGPPLGPTGRAQQIANAQQRRLADPAGSATRNAAIRARRAQRAEATGGVAVATQGTGRRVSTLRRKPKRRSKNGRGSTRKSSVSRYR